MVDVCLLLEGTFPYVAGGVSSWVYRLIKELNELTFSIVYLGAQPTEGKRLHYDLPDNIVDFREYHLFGYKVGKENFQTSAADYEKFQKCLSQIRSQNVDVFDDLYKMIGPAESRRLSLYDISYSKKSWEVIKKLYYMEDREMSFIDYFWTWRFLYMPFFSLMRINLPEAKVYHSISTGYAGVLAVMCKLCYNRPIILTEHGIYTKERKIEITQADWIYSESTDEAKVIERIDFFREWWIDLFLFLSNLVYDRADQIITLYEGNRQLQIEEGADPQKTLIIPNGIDLNRVDSMLKPDAKKNDGIFRVGFVGRVVPIKDVKTLIVAFRRIRDELSNVEFYIIGPTDEDEEYYKECVLLCEMEAIDDIVHFVGKVNPFDYYSLIDVLILTSISEAQPLVILEAQACSVPVVSTDVGSCRELLYGQSPDDKLLGESGIITPMCDPEATNQAVVKILKDDNLRKKMGEIGRERVKQFYQLKDLIANYRMLYAKYGEEIRWL